MLALPGHTSEQRTGSKPRGQSADPLLTPGPKPLDRESPIQVGCELDFLDHRAAALHYIGFQLAAKRMRTIGSLLDRPSTEASSSYLSAITDPAWLFR